MMSKMSYHHTPIGCPLDGRVWHQLLDAKAQHEPDTEAAIFYDINMKRSTLTYAEYRDRSKHLAASLIKLGLSYGDRALLIGNSSPQYLIFMMALHRLGAKTVLLGPGDLTLDKVNFIVTKNINCRLIAYDPDVHDSQARQLVIGINQLVQHNGDWEREPLILVSLNYQGNPNQSSAGDNITTSENQSISSKDRNAQKQSDYDKADANHISATASHFQKSHTLSKMAEQHDNKGKVIFYSYDELLNDVQSQDSDMLFKAEAKLGPDDESVAMVTSGSTGEPKIVQHTTHSLSNFYTGNLGVNAVSQRCKLYLDRPLCWIGGFLYSYMPLFWNITIVCVPTEMSINEHANYMVFKILEEEKVSLCSLSELLINKLIKDTMHLKHDLSNIKLFMLGGQRYNLSLMQAVFDIFPKVIISIGYGSTEAPKLSSQIMVKANAIESMFGKMNVLPGVEVKVVDEQNKIVPCGTLGEICVRSYSVFLEYLENPDETKKVKSKNAWFHTGDIGCLDDQGKVQVLGRMSTIIKRLTAKILPAEIENVIKQHPLVSDVIVVGIPDQRLNEEICACVILRHDAKDTSRDEQAKLKELEDWCEGQWPPRADGLSLKPKYFLLMKTFPVSASGKPSIKGVKAEALKQLAV